MTLSRAGAALVLAVLASGCSDPSAGLPQPPPTPPDTVTGIGGTGDIRVDSGTVYQTITGWEAHAQSGHYHPQFRTYRDALFDQAVHDLGITRLRLEPRASLEHSRDIEDEYQRGTLDDATYYCNRFATVNDNDDPFTINWNGFKFSSLDYLIDEVIIPVRQRLASRGEALFLLGTYTAFFNGSCAGVDYHHDDPEEYAEFVLAVHLHMQQKYGFVPDAWEVILEPDNTSFWRGPEIGRAIAAAARRLRQHGFEPRFVAPSTKNMTRAIAYFDEMIRIPGVIENVSELSYHRYTGVSDASLQAIADRAVTYGINTSMLEHIGSGHEDLHRDLSLGRVSAWQQFTLAWYEGGDNGGKYFIIDTGSSGASVRMGRRSRYLRQYFRYVRPGAVRIGTSSTRSGLDPLAFINRSGGWVVVIKADGAATFSVGGLPAGTYGVTYTTDAHWHAAGSDVVLGRNEALPASIPAAGVLTIFRR